VDLLAPLRSEPGASAVLIDFDGTVAPIVDVPDDARPLAGVAEALGRLCDQFALVAVLSGRPVDFLAGWMPAKVHVSGLYGIESAVGGQRMDDPQAGAWREVVNDVVAVSIGRGPDGMRVESKGLSITLHYRTRPDVAEEVRRWAEVQASRSGLQVRPAKMSVELHPPLAVDKGTTLVELCHAASVTAACYVGDDVGDLPAFDGLDRLAEEGIHTVRVAVTGPETPVALTARADLTVDGASGVLAFLESLAT